jgi:Lysophospholipase L1 and related esterases
MKKIIKVAGIIGIITLTIFNATAQQTNYKFQMGCGKAPQGYLQIGSSSVFSEKIGYGIDLGSTVKIVNRGGQNPIRSSFMTSEKPFFFSVNVPEGNYKVTLTIGDSKEAGNLTVKAESRRLMLENVITKPGEFVTKTFIVNIRKPEIKNGGRVSLKEREVNKLDWDNKLTLEFNGSKPCISSIEIEKTNDQITVFLAGNSTVVDQSAEPWASWGQMITRFFKPGIAIANHAESGLTLASFKSQHRLEKILSIINPGDYLFIEFGHNDQKMKGENDGAWKSYTENFKYFIEEVKKKKANAVVITSTSRRRFDEMGNTINTLGDFPAAARKVALDEQVPMIDLNKMTAILYNALGVEKSIKAFVHYPANTFPGQKKALADNTHFNSYGAYEIAKCIIEGIREKHLSLEKFLVDLPAFDPAHPDSAEEFNLPQTPGIELIKPDGN